MSHRGSGCSFFPFVCPVSFSPNSARRASSGWRRTCLRTGMEKRIRPPPGKRARSPLVPGGGNAVRRQLRCSAQTRWVSARHELLSPGWCGAAAVVPSKRQRRVLKPFPLLRLVLTRPHEAELQLLRLVKAYEADDESLTLDQLLQAAKAAPPPAEAAPAPAATPPPRPMRTVSGERARLCYEASRAANISVGASPSPTAGGLDALVDPRTLGPLDRVRSLGASPSGEG